MQRLEIKAWQNARKEKNVAFNYEKMQNDVNYSPEGCKKQKKTPT